MDTEISIKKISVTADDDGVAKIHDFIDATLEEYMPPDGPFTPLGSKMHLIADEICANIASYSGAGKLIFSIGTDDNGLYIKTTDDGVPYNPLDHDVAENPEPSENGGLGIFLVRKLSKSLQYEYTAGENNFTVVV